MKQYKLLQNWLSFIKKFNNKTIQRLKSKKVNHFALHKLVQDCPIIQEMKHLQESDLLEFYSFKAAQQLLYIFFLLLPPLEINSIKKAIYFQGKKPYQDFTK